MAQIFADLAVIDAPSPRGGEAVGCENCETAGRCERRYAATTVKRGAWSIEPGPE